jgi:DNA damage-binding protein 1
MAVIIWLISSLNLSAVRVSFPNLNLFPNLVKGSLSSSESTSNTSLQAKHVFFASSGRIGVIVDVIDDELSLHLTALQRNLVGVLQGVGGVTHTRLLIY